MKPANLAIHPKGYITGTLRIRGQMSIFPNPSPGSGSEPPYSPPPAPPSAPPPSAPPPGAPAYYAAAAAVLPATAACSGASQRRVGMEARGSVWSARGRADRRQCLPIHAVGQGEEGSHGRQRHRAIPDRQAGRSCQRKHAQQPTDGGRASRSTGTRAPASEPGRRTGQG